MQRLVAYASSDDSDCDASPPDYSESSDDALHPVSSSERGQEAGDEGSCRPVATAAPLPPVPPSLRSLFGSDVDNVAVEDRAEHLGRSRTFAHERGNWATHLYIVPDEYARSALEETAVELVMHLNRCAGGRWLLHAVEDTHVSLSRSFPVRHHYIRPMTESLAAALSSARSFRVSLAKVAVYVNDERTRTFVGLNVTRGSAELRRIVNAVDSVLIDYGLPAYYAQPSFHASLCWTLGDVFSELSATVAAYTDGGGLALVSGTSDDVQFSVEDVFFKCGNKTNRMPLAGVAPGPLL